MGPETVISIAGGALSAAKGFFEVGKALWTFYQDAKGIDATMEAFAGEVRTLGTACNLIGERLEGIVKEQDAEIARQSSSDDMQESLWGCLKEQVEACSKTVLQLKDAVRPGSRDYNKNVTLSNQATRQFKLNMQASEIVELRNRVQAHTSSLQLMLLVVATTVAYIVPQRGGQELRTQIAELSSKVDEVRNTQLSRNTESMAEGDNVINVTNKVIHRAETLYAASVAGGSEFIPSGPRRTTTMDAWMRDLSMIDEMQENQKRSLNASQQHESSTTSMQSGLSETPILEKVGQSVLESVVGGLKPGQELAITDWLQHTETIEEHASETSESTPLTETSSLRSSARQQPSQYTDTSITTPSMLKSAHEEADDLDLEEDDYDDDGILLEAAEHAMKEGKEAFEQKDYSEACPMLEEALKIVLELPVNKQSICDTFEIRHMLGVCAFHLKTPEEARPVLLQVLEHALKAKGQTNARRLQTCETGHLLSQTCLRLGKIAEARQYCTNALQGRRRLLGKNHEICFDSYALLSRIEELDGNSRRSKLYSLSIPQERRADLLKSYGTFNISQYQLERSISQDSTDRTTSPRFFEALSPVATSPELTTRETTPNIPGEDSANLGRPTPVHRSPSLPNDTAEDQIPHLAKVESSERIALANSSVMSVIPGVVVVSHPLNAGSEPAPRQATNALERDSLASSSTENQASHGESQETTTTETQAAAIAASSTLSAPLVATGSGSAADSPTMESRNFKLEASRFRNAALKKLVASVGYQPPSPASADLRNMWTAWFNFRADTPLKEMLLKGDTASALELAKSHRKGTHWWKSKSSSTALELHRAALFGEIDVVAALLSRGVKAGYKSPAGRLAIDYAAIGGYNDIVRLLLTFGSAVGDSLAYATLLERLDVVDHLLSLHFSRESGDWAVHAACATNWPLLLEAVTAEEHTLRESARLRLCDLQRFRKSVQTGTVARKVVLRYAFEENVPFSDMAILLSPVQVAAFCGCVSTLSYLSERGVTSSYHTAISLSSHRFTSMDLLSIRGDAETFRAKSKLFTSPLDDAEDKNEVLDDFYGSLFYADLNGHKNWMSELLRLEIFFETALNHITSEINHNDRKFNSEDWRWKRIDDPRFFKGLRAWILRGMIQLDCLCDIHNPQVAKAKMEDVDVSTFEDKSSADGGVLHAAARANLPCAVAWLIRHSAKIDAVDNKGQTSLLLAILRNHRRVAEILIRSGASKTKQSNSGDSPLAAAKNSPLVIWKILFDDRYHISKSSQVAKRKEALAELQMESSPDDRAIGVAQLLSLGFNKSQAIMALNVCNGNVSAAANLLTARAQIPPGYEESDQSQRPHSVSIWKCPKGPTGSSSGEISVTPIFGQDLASLPIDSNEAVPTVILNCIEVIEIAARTHRNYFSADRDTNYSVPCEVKEQFVSFAGRGPELDIRWRKIFEQTEFFIDTLEEILVALPAPVIPVALQGLLRVAYDSGFENIRAMLDSLSTAQFATVRALALHFWRMQEYSESSLSDVSRFAVRLLFGKSADIDAFEEVMSIIIAGVHDIFYSKPTTGLTRFKSTHRESADEHLGVGTGLVD